MIGSPVLGSELDSTCTVEPIVAPVGNVHEQACLLSMVELNPRAATYPGNVRSFDSQDPALAGLPYAYSAWNDHELSAPSNPGRM